MQVLAVSPRPIYPVTDGYSLRKYHLLGELSDLHQVDLLFSAASDEGMHVLQEEFRAVHRIDDEGTALPTRRLNPLRWYRNLRAIATGRPLSTLCDSQALADELRNLTRLEDYSVIMFLDWRLVEIADVTGSIPVVIDVCDSPTLILGRELDSAVAWQSRLALWLELKATQVFFRFVLEPPSKAVLVSSEDESDVRAHAPDLDTAVVPNGVDRDYFRRSRKYDAAEPTVLFSGVMSYPPNVSAAIYAAESVLPVLRREAPDLELVIAGREPTEEVRRLAERIPGVVVTGEVPDLRPYYEKAAVYLCPMRSGAGLKNKILEAWAMEVPVVANPLCCQGLSVTDGHNALVGEDAEELAGAVLRVLRDPSLARRLGRAGRNTVEREYSWSSRGKELEAVLQAAARS